jgi:predicted dienelactone hydrolase
VVFYSPSGQISQNTALCEELASHGYVVFSVAHPYWNAFHYDENGKVVPLDVNNAYFNALWEEERSSAAAAAKEKITISADREAREEAFRELNAQMPLEVADLRLWGEDLTFLLTELGQLNQNGGRWHGMFDLERVGAVGFSKGGAAAGQFCISDPRCRAGVNLSGFMFGDIVEKSLPCPFLFLENYEDWCEECAPINTLFEDTAEAITYTVRIRNAKHGNFSDWSLVGKFLQLIDVIGPIDGHRFLKIQNEYVRGFFDKHLKGLPVPILESPPTSDPDVVFRARSATIDPSTPIS